MATQGRRAVLTGAGEWEREERLSQQRDYAAQLQEQVRLKQAAAEQKKARRRHEQQLEREEMDRDRAATTKQRQQQQPAMQPIDQQQQHHQHQSPAKSPPRRSWTFPQMEPEMAHSTAILGSPSKAGGRAPSQPYGAQQLHHPVEQQQQQQQHSVGYAGGSFTSSYTVAPAPGGSPQKFFAPPPPATYTYSFASAPSVFETLLRESEQSAAARSGSKFHEALESLRRLNAEVDQAWRERCAAAQNTYIKPNFVLQPDARSPVAVAPGSLVRPMEPSPVKRSHGSPFKLHQVRTSIDFEQQQMQEDGSDEDELELGGLSSQSPAEIGGLLGESVLIPLTKAHPMAGAAAISPTRRSASPVKGVETLSLRSPVLRHNSEMMAFARSSE